MDPITIALGLAQLVPGLLRYFDAGEPSIAVAEKVIGIAQQITGAPSGDSALGALKADPALLQQYQLAVLKKDQEIEMAYLSDRQDARKRDSEFIRMGKTNVRANVMLALTFLGICASTSVMIFRDIDANTALGGVLLMLIGKFVSMWGTAFDFEYGTSIGSKIKDEQNLVTAIKEARK